jgi:hypothetical protein
MPTVNFNVTSAEKELLERKAKKILRSSLTEIFRAMIPLALSLNEDGDWSTRFISHVSSTQAGSLFCDNKKDAVTVAAPVPKRLAEDFAAQVREDGGFQYPAHALARALFLFALPAIVTELSSRLEKCTPSASNLSAIEAILDGHRYCYADVRRAIDELQQKADDAGKRLEEWDSAFVKAGKEAGGTWAKAVEYMIEHREAERRMRELYNKPRKKGEKS